LLREMMLRARREAEEDPRMPDEQLHANDQLQRDEVLLSPICPQYASLLGVVFQNPNPVSVLCSHASYTCLNPLLVGTPR
jgi:hypothetical protein